MKLFLSPFNKEKKKWDQIKQIIAEGLTWWKQFTVYCAHNGKCPKFIWFTLPTTPINPQFYIKTIIKCLGWQTCTDFLEIYKCKKGPKDPYLVGAIQVQISEKDVTWIVW